MSDMRHHIRESNLIEGYDSIKADALSRASWLYLSRKNWLKNEHVRHLQEMIVDHQDDLKPEWIGKYRTIPVYIGHKEAPHYSNIAPQMDEILDILNRRPASVDPQKLHVMFEHIHPFVDGNGRTGRMLMWWHERKLGREPTLIKASDKQEYYKWFA